MSTGVLTAQRRDKFKQNFNSYITAVRWEPSELQPLKIQTYQGQKLLKRS